MYLRVRCLYILPQEEWTPNSPEVFCSADKSGHA